MHWDWDWDGDWDWGGAAGCCGIFSLSLADSLAEVWSGAGSTAVLLSAPPAGAATSLVTAPAAGEVAASGLVVILSGTLADWVSLGDWVPLGDWGALAD